MILRAPSRLAAAVSALVAATLLSGCSLAGTDGGRHAGGPRGEAPSRSTAAGPDTPEMDRSRLYACGQGFGELPKFNTTQMNKDRVFGWRGYDPVKLVGQNDRIDWDLDPHDDAVWRLWLSSLRWVGPSIEAARDGDDDAYATALEIAHDWRDAHHGGWGDDPDDTQANTHRLNVLLCLRDTALLRNAGAMPDDLGWLDDLIAAHAEQNMAKYSRRHNHGSNENRALLGAGCVYDRKDWRRHAIARAEEDIPFQVDAEGLSNEASAHYARYNFALFSDIMRLIEVCEEESDAFTERIDAMGRALPHLVDTTRHQWQYGDSPEREVGPGPRDTPQMRWAATGGREGVRPEERVKGFEAGLVFGRSSWGGPQGYDGAASWMLRAGTGGEVKAHRGDRGQLLYATRGRQVVVDAGHPGTQKDHWRRWGHGPTAHNVLHLPTVGEFPGDAPATVTWTQESADGRSDGAGTLQKLKGGGERTRDVLVLTGPDAAVVVDRAAMRGVPAGGGSEHRAEVLWNLPTSYRAERIDDATVRAVDEAGGEATTLVQLRLDGARVGADGTSLHRGELDDEDGHLHRGWHYPGEGVRVPSDQVVFHAEGEEVGIVSVLLPAGLDDEVSVEGDRGDDGALTLRIQGPGGEAEVRISPMGLPERVR